MARRRRWCTGYSQIKRNHQHIGTTAAAAAATGAAVDIIRCCNKQAIINIVAVSDTATQETSGQCLQCYTYKTFQVCESILSVEHYPA